MGRVPKSLQKHTFKKGGTRAKKGGSKGGKKSRPPKRGKK